MNDYPSASYSYSYNMGPGGFLIGLAFYAYFAYVIMVLSDKTKTPHGWWGWVPILNVLQLIKVAGKPYWWIILFLIPVVNIVIAIIIWMEIAKRRGFESWYGILMIIPFVNFIMPGYLAFAEPAKKAKV